jgi:hypothetical protein
LPTYDPNRTFLVFGHDLDIGCKAAFGVMPAKGFKINFENGATLQMGAYYTNKVAGVSAATHVIILAHSNGGTSLVCQGHLVAPATLAGFLDANFGHATRVDIFACSLGAGRYGFRLFDAFAAIGDNSAPDFRLPKFTVAQNQGIVCLVDHYAPDIPSWDAIPPGHIIANSTIGGLASYNTVVDNGELFLAL